MTGASSQQSGCNFRLPLQADRKLASPRVANVLAANNNRPMEFRHEHVHRYLDPKRVYYPPKNIGGRGHGN